jgi:hypothetical protein
MGCTPNVTTLDRKKKVYELEDELHEGSASKGLRLVAASEFFRVCASGSPNGSTRMPKPQGFDEKRIL